MNFGSDVEHLSIGVAIVLILSYVAGLFFSLRTHKDIFNPATARTRSTRSRWSIKRSLILLGVAGALVGLMSEILVGLDRGGVGRASA